MPCSWFGNLRNDAIEALSVNFPGKTPRPITDTSVGGRGRSSHTNRRCCPLGTPRRLRLSRYKDDLISGVHGSPSWRTGSGVQLELVNLRLCVPWGARTLMGYPWGSRDEARKELTLVKPPRRWNTPGCSPASDPRCYDPEIVIWNRGSVCGCTLRCPPRKRDRVRFIRA